MADSIKDGCWPKSAHISYARNALLLWHTYVHICTYIYIFIPRRLGNGWCIKMIYPCCVGVIYPCFVGVINPPQFAR